METVHQRGRYLQPVLSEPALATLAALAPGDQDPGTSQSEQASSTTPAPPQTPSRQERTDLTGSSSARSRSVHSVPVPAQAPAVGDRLELECSSIAFGGQVRDLLAVFEGRSKWRLRCVCIETCYALTFDCSGEGEPDAMHSAQPTVDVMHLFLSKRSSWTVLVLGALP